MLYRTIQGTVVDMDATTVVTFRHRRYTVAIVSTVVNGETLSTMGISKYNPKDDKLLVSSELDGTKSRIRVSMQDPDFGEKVAVGRALAALRRGEYGNYEMNAASLPEGLVKKVFVKTLEDRAFVESQKKAVEAAPEVNKDEEVLCI